MSKIKSKIELLAPVGSKESLEAAIHNGADAVYLSGYKYGARANASNFDLEELRDGVEYAHLRNVKVFCTVNTLIYENEAVDFLEYVQFLYNIGVDALILQDVGMANLVSKYFPNFELHGSTQMSIMNSLDGILAKEMGFKRIVVARENSEEEIKVIKDNTKLDIEAFVHGALCVSYSGKCLSSFIQGGRSGNRGDCAQPCRLKCSVYDEEQNVELFQDSHFLSTKDLSAIKEINSLVNSGIDSFKIEGRMRRSEYVAIAVSNYRKAIDNRSNLTLEELEAMELENKYVFNREYTKGYLLNEEPQKIVSHNSPKNKGVIVAKVVEINRKNKRIKLELFDDLRVGDGTSLGESVGRILTKDNTSKDIGKKGEMVYLDFVGKAEINQIIYKTYNSQIMKKAIDSSSSEYKKFKLSLELKIKIGEAVKCRIWDEDGNQGVFEMNDIIVEKALTQPTSKEIVMRQIGKLESTVYVLDYLELDIEAGARVAISDLNKIRRSAIELINSLRIKNPREPLNIDFLREDRLWIYENKKNSNGVSELSVKCHTKDQFSAAIEMSVENIILANVELYEEAVKYLEKQKGSTKLWIATASVLKDRDIEELKKFIEKYLPNVVTCSLGFGKWCKDLFDIEEVDSKISFDYMSNVLNPWSFKYVKELIGDRLYSVIPSLEISKDEEAFNSVIENFDYIEIPSAIHPLLMITEYCPFKKDSKMCGSICKMEGKTLIPERGIVQIFKREQNCKLSLYTKEIQSTSKIQLSDYHKKGVNKYRIDLLNEDFLTTKMIINNMTNLLK